MTIEAWYKLHVMNYISFLGVFVLVIYQHSQQLIVSNLGTNTSDPSHEGTAGSTTCTIGMYRKNIAGPLWYHITKFPERDSNHRDRERALLSDLTTALPPSHHGWFSSKCLTSIGLNNIMDDIRLIEQKT